MTSNLTCKIANIIWAAGSAVERFPDKKEVLGPTPRQPTEIMPTTEIPYETRVNNALNSFIRELEQRFPNEVTQVEQSFGTGVGGWGTEIAHIARALWERQDPRYSTREAFESFVSGPLEENLKEKERQGLPSILIDEAFRLGEIYTRTGEEMGMYKGYGPLRRKRT